MTFGTPGRSLLGAFTLSSVDPNARGPGGPAAPPEFWRWWERIYKVEGSTPPPAFDDCDTGLPINYNAVYSADMTSPQWKRTDGYTQAPPAGDTLFAILGVRTPTNTYDLKPFYPGVDCLRAWITDPDPPQCGRIYTQEIGGGTTLPNFGGEFLAETSCLHDISSEWALELSWFFNLFTLEGSPPVDFPTEEPFSWRVESIGYENPAGWQLIGAPSGMTVDGSGLITWPSPTAGVYNFDVRGFTNYGGLVPVNERTDPFTLTFRDYAPILNPVSDQVVPAGTFMDVVVTKSQGDQPITWSMLQEQPGTSLIPSGDNEEARVRWEAVAGGPYTFEIQALNDWGVDTQSWQVTVT